MNTRKPTDRNPQGGEGPDGDQPIRRELVNRVRRQIAAGIYETPEKLEIALCRLLQEGLDE
jgi:hypothetical protein